MAKFAMGTLFGVEEPAPAATANSGSGQGPQ